MRRTFLSSFLYLPSGQDVLTFLLCRGRRRDAANHAHDHFTPLAANCVRNKLCGMTV